jgi:anti-anti-sigma factor
MTLSLDTAPAESHPLIEDQADVSGATFAAGRVSPTRAIVTVCGDIDALNAREFGRYVARHTGKSRQLVVDLRAVDFFGTHGFRALYYLDVHCTRADVDWVIVGNRAVHRVLAVCDPHGQLPRVSGYESALARLNKLQRCRYTERW